MVVPSFTLSCTYTLLISMFAPVLDSRGPAAYLGSMPDEVAALVETCRHRYVEKPHHHLVVSRLAPARGRLRVRVMRIVTRIIVPGDGLQLRPGFQQTRFRETVAHLPVEVIMDVEQRFHFPILARARMRFSVNNVVRKPFSTQVHVRKKAQQRRIVRQSSARFHTIIRRSRWNYKVIVRKLQCKHALRGSMPSKNQPQAGLVAPRVPIGGVVHLKNKVGPSR